MSRDLKLKFLLNCSGISNHTEEYGRDHWRNGGTRNYQMLDRANFAVAPGYFVQVDTGLAKGSIGEIVDVDFGERGAYNVRRGTDEVSVTDMTFIFQVEGKKGTNRIPHYHCEVLEEDYTGRTRWIRSKGKVKEAIPEHVNKYHQTIYMGDWVAGIGACKTLYFGQINRWSKASVWVNPTPSVAGSKSSCINNPNETIVLPAGVDYEQTVTMMVLQGWRG